MATMETAQVRSVLQRLLGSAEAASALAVHFARMSGALTVSDELATRVQAVADAVLGDTSGVAPEQARVLGAMARALLAQAAAFASKPDQPESWSVTDPVVLQSLGQASAVFAPYICGPLATRLAGLPEALAAPGAAVLDVGVGVGALALAFAETLPRARVVGLDVWEPSLALARANLARAGAEARVELRLQDICALEDRDTYELVWFSGPFIPGALQPRALERCVRALKPGGWLVYGAFGGQDPLTSALADLRTVRSGGPVLTDAEVVRMLEEAGLTEVHSARVELAIPSRMVVGRRIPQG